MTPLIDITMTATRRPDIIKQTLSSFYRNMLAPVIDRCRIIVNIDPVGENIASHEIVPIIAGYFSHYYVNLPMTSSFPHAFKWVWEQSDAPWVLNLEDDWELLEKINIHSLIDMMLRYPALASLRLPFFNAQATSMKNWNLIFPWNGEYFECPADLRQTAGFAGHPSLLRGDFVQHCASLLSTDANPEKQFHHGNDNLIHEVLRWQYGVWSKPNAPKVLKDIGAEWKIRNQIQKKGVKAFFTEWEKMKKE